MKTGKRCCLARIAIFLLTPSALVFAEVHSGFWLLSEPSADSLTRVDFSELASSDISPIYRNTTHDTGATDCYFRNGKIVAPNGVVYDSVLSLRCDSVIAGKKIGLTYSDHFYLDSMMKRLQLSILSGGVYADSIVTSRSCKVFFLKTRENHCAVIFRVGEYIGGINRTWFYWAYRPNEGATLFKQQLCELPNPRQLKIGLDVFSGRPNPEFIIDDSATIAAITHAAFASINTLFDTTLQTVGMPECPGILGYRGLSVSGGFKIDNRYSDYLPTFVICSGNITLQHSEPWKSAIAPLKAKDRGAALEKLLIGYGCERNLTVTDGYGTLRFCDLVPDSLKPASARVAPTRATRTLRSTAPNVSILGKTIRLTNAQNVYTIDVFNLAGGRTHSFVCSGGETTSFLLPDVNNRCILVSLRFADGSSTQVRKVALR